MMTFLVLLATASPAQTPQSAPAAVIDAASIAAWVADLSDKDAAKRDVASVALQKAGPKAKSAVPDLINLLAAKDGGSSEAIDILGAIGPDAKDAVPALIAKLAPSAWSGGNVDRIAVVLARIMLPAPKPPAALLLSSSKGAAIYLSNSLYLRDFTPKVIPQIIDLCCDKDVVTRTKAATALGSLQHGTRLSDGPKPVWKPLIEFAGDSAKDIPIVLEKLLGDESSDVRIAAALAITRVAPQLIEKMVPVVIALVTEEMTLKIGVHQAIEIFWLFPEQAAKAIIPLFDNDKEQVRSWAIQTLASLRVEGQLESALKDGKTAHMREAAAVTLGSKGARVTAAIPTLKIALADTEFAVRFAAANALVQICGPRSETSAIAVPMLIEGLKQVSEATRLTACHDLFVIGPAAKQAIPTLKEFLRDKSPSLVMEAALAVVTIAPTDTVDALPILIRGLGEKDAVAIRVAKSLGQLGEAAKAAIPELVKKFDAKNLDLRLAILTAAGQIDQTQAERATAVLVAMLVDNKLKYSLRPQVIIGLGQMGAGAKSAVPILLEQLKDQKSPFHVEIVLAAIAIDPETAKPALQWLRERLSKENDDDLYDIMEQLQTLGVRAKLLMPEVMSKLKSKIPQFRQFAVMTLSAIGPDAKDALPQLKEMAATDQLPKIRQLAADAIKKIEAK